MNRNYLSAGLLTLTASVALTLAITAAPASGWQKVGRAPVERKVTKTPVSERTQYLRSIGRVSSTTPIGYELPEVMRTPAVNDRVMAPKSVQHRTIANPRGNFLAVVPMFYGMEEVQEAYIGNLNIATGKLDPLNFGRAWCPNIGDDYTLQSGIYINGYIYVPGQSMDYQELATAYHWTKYDAETFEPVADYSFGTDVFGAPYTMTYDEKNNVVYGLSVGAGSDGHFIIFHPDKYVTNDINDEFGGQFEYIAKLKTNGFAACLTYNPLDEQLYCFTETNDIYIVDPHTGECIEAGYLEYDYVPFEAGYSGQVTYSPMDQMFVGIYRDNALKAVRLLYINPENWEVVEGPLVSAPETPYIASLLCTDAFASADAPEQAPAMDVNFVKSSLSGTIGIEAPMYTYYGVEIGSTPLDAVLKIDGNVVFEGKMSAGEKKVINQTLAEGLHTIEFTTAIGGEVSPVRKAVVYTGYDTPFAPKNLALDIDVLTWEDPAAIGVNGGFVDLRTIEYNVYVDDVMQNVMPLEENTYKLRLPNDMKLAKIEVEAVVRGKASERASLKSVIGKPMALPLLQAPTREDRDLCTILNVNEDNQRWVFASLDDVKCYAFEIGYFQDANDWIVFPAVNFPDQSTLYNISFDLINLKGAYSEEGLGVYVGKKPTVDALKEGTVVIQRDKLPTSGEWQEISYDFAVSEPGAYYVGIYCNSSKSVSAAGYAIKNIAIKAQNDKSSAVPAEATNVKIKAGDFGDMIGIVTLDLPTLDIVGNALPADQQLTATISTTGGSVNVSGKPGETVSAICATDHDGFSDFEISVANELGKGYTRIYTTYIGIDVPFAPQNIKGEASEDNMQITLTWDAPPSIGVNGGYVDVDDLTYSIHSRSGISYYKVGETKNTYTVFNVTDPKQQDYHIGPSVYNQAGQSQYSVFVQDMLGTPYKAPVTEYWNSSKFSLGPYTANTTGRYAASEWANTRTADGFDLDGCILNQGGMVAYSYAPSDARLTLCKLSTKGIHNGVFILRYWDYALTPEIDIYGRRFGHSDVEKLFTIVPNNYEKGEFVNASFSLPAEYNNCGWIQLMVETHLSGDDAQVLMLDSFQLISESEYDLTVTELDGPVAVSLGEDATYNVQVSNGGSESHSGVLTTELINKETGVVYATDQTPVSNLRSAQVFERNVVFPITGEFTDIKELVVRATVSATPDENSNNDMLEQDVTVYNAPIAAVSDLKAELNEDGAVELSWSTPDGNYGGFENFEYLPAFRNNDRLGMWKNINLDGHNSAVFESGSLTINWEGATEPSGWTVIDTEKLGIQYDARAYPHSGKNYLMARAAMIGEEDDPSDFQSDKWLISPEIVGGTKLSFYINALTSDTEYAQLWYSTTTDELGTPSKINPTVCGSFKRLRLLSKSGDATWELVEEILPENAKYFAIRYVTYDGYAMMIDDLCFTQATPANNEIESYAIYRSDNGGDFQLIADNVTDLNYVDTTYADTSSRYYVVANTTIDDVKMKGPKSNLVLVAGTSVGEIDAAAAVVGGIGEISFYGFDGNQAEIFATDGKKVGATVIRGQHASVAADKGIYLVVVADRKVKVIVK